MEIFFVSAKSKAQRALSGAFQLCLPAPNQRLLLCVGAFVSPEDPWQRRSRARQIEKLLQDASASLKSVSELWAQLAKKLPEITQNPLVFALLLEDGALEMRFGGLGSLLIKSESKQKIMALQSDSLALSAEVMAGAKELIFFEEAVDRAEEIAALLQDAEQTLGEAAVRRLLVVAPSEPIPLPTVKDASHTPREVVVPMASPPWQQYAPWGVAAMMTLLFCTSLLWRAPASTASTKASVIDTRPKFIPQPEEPIAEAKKVEKKKVTPEEPSTQPEPKGLLAPQSLPTSALGPTSKPKEAAKPKTLVKPAKTIKKPH